MLIRLAMKSLANRKGSVLLTLISISLSVFLLVSVEHIRLQTKESFNRTVSGVDLIVGARTSSLNLLLHSVFRIGNASNGISRASVQTITNHPQIDWVIPISLGDSHKGYAVLGTNNNYFQHFKYGNKQPLVILAGEEAIEAPFDRSLTVVIGADVAAELGYRAGEAIGLSHGTGKVSFSHHDEHEFEIIGILKKTGTPVDKTVHISIDDVAKIHGWQDQPKESVKITAFLLGLKTPIAVLQLQYVINQFETEPLTAIVPGVALAELWSLLSSVEQVLFVVTVMVLISSMLGLSIMMLSSMRERAQEMRILRIVGAGPAHLFVLLELETTIVTMAGILTGLLCSFLFFLLFDSFLSDSYGIFISSDLFTFSTMNIVLAVLFTALIVSILPAFSAYRSKFNLN